MRRSFKILSIILICFSFLSISYAAETKPIEKVYLHGTFFEMGKQYTTKLGPRLVKQYEAVMAAFKEGKGGKLFEDEAKLIDAANQLTLRYPSAMHAFFNGAASSAYARAHGLTFQKLVLLDQGMLLSSIAHHGMPSKPSPVGRCSFLGINGEKTIVGRNVDWLIEFQDALTRDPVVIEMDHSDKKAYPHKILLVTYVGAVSTVSVANDAGLFAAANSGSATVGGNFVLTRPYYLSQLSLALMKADSFDDLRTWAETTPPDFGFILNLAGPGKLASVELAPFAVDSQRLRAQLDEGDANKLNGFMYGTRKLNGDGFLVATNTFRFHDWESWLGHPISDETATFSRERFNNLTNIAMRYQIDSILLMQWALEKTLNGYGSLPGATENVASAEGRYQTNPDATYISMVFDTQSKILSVRNQFATCRSQQGKKVCEGVFGPWQRFAFSS